MREAEVQGRQQVSDAAAAAYQARREALHGAVTDLEHELEALEAQPVPDARRLLAALRGLRTTLLEHVEHADAPGGLLTQVFETAPWFANRTDQLRNEHGDLLAATDGLIERAGAGDAVETLLSDAHVLADRISDHRHRGTALLLDAFMLDIPAGD